MKKLKPCPCGKTPKKLDIRGGDSKWKYVSGDCCGEWEIEFRTGYFKDDTKECMEAAINYWNHAPRK